MIWYLGIAFLGNMYTHIGVYAVQLEKEKIDILTELYRGKLYDGLYITAADTGK